MSKKFSEIVDFLGKVCILLRIETIKLQIIDVLLAYVKISILKIWVNFKI